MELLSIENLSLAAEVTVVLLLLSFVWPQNRTHLKEPIENSESIGWEPVKFFFLQNWLHRGVYLNQWKQHIHPITATSQAFQPAVVENNDSDQIPKPWQDRLTHLLNRQGFDAIFNAWLSVGSQYRGASCVSMITLSAYSDLTSVHGAMVTEQAIQRIGEQLSCDLSPNALIARYLPDRFVVLHFAASTSSSQKAMAQLHAQILDDSFFQLAGEPLHLPCNISILGIESESNANATLDMLEDGISEGQRNDKAIVSHKDGEWSDNPIDLETTPIEALFNEPASQSLSSTSIAIEAIAKEVKSDTPELKLASTASASIAKSSSSEDSQQSSNDISAVASPDDIAALFAQINTQKHQKGEIAPQAKTETATQSIPKEAASTHVTASSEVATADDIAALFATVKPNAKSTVVPTIPPSAAAPAIAELDTTEAATADDIAALFATIKPTEKAAKAIAPTSSPTAANFVKNEISKPVADVDPNEVASADDIAALFATVKPTVRATQEVVPPSKETAQSSKSNGPAPHVDHNEAATMDDIAALFDTVKPIVKAPIAITPTAANAPNLSDEKRSESATVDDIAALFATVKAVVKPEVYPPAVLSKPMPSAENASSIPTGAELAEVATADDIALLLATVKPVTPVSSQIDLVAKTASSAIPPSETLNGAASPDDIAALFASVKPSSQVNAASQSTPLSPTTPISTLAAQPGSLAQGDLSANASLDDIEALFAAMKK